LRLPEPPQDYGYPDHEDDAPSYQRPIDHAWGLNEDAIRRLAMDEEDFWFDLIVIVGALFLIGIGYVVVHFITKFW
jgi:hypothetical protein